jgi:PAS domain S-box-containing protein
VNAQANIEMVNAQTENLFGYTREELLGQPIEILIPEPYRSRHPEQRDSYIADPHARAMGVGLELYALRKGGSQFPVEISLSPIETVDGIHIISAVRDISERKRMDELRSLNVELEQRVHERTAQLESINKELEAFSYSVSHDLRAPLRTLDGFSQALLEDYADKLDDTGQNLLRRIRAGSQRMGQLIDDLLQLSRLSRAEMRMAQVDLSAMAQEIAAELREQNPSREVKLIVGEGMVVRGDIRLLRVALGNLLGNAWKFTGKQPEACVEFGVTEHDQKPVYFVRDNGAGFDMAYADKLFGAFQRLHGMTEFEGTGIGLATVQRVLQRHGGRIWAEAAVNKGATFYFVL